MTPASFQMAKGHGYGGARPSGAADGAELGNFNEHIPKPQTPCHVEGRDIFRTSEESDFRTTSFVTYRYR